MNTLAQELRNEQISVNIMAVDGQRFNSTQEEIRTMAALGSLPIVLETAQQPVWQNWGAEWRDLYIVDRDGDFYRKINLTDYDPDRSVANGQNYAQLKSWFVTAYNTGVNQNPIANPQTLNATQGTPLTITLTGDDGDANYTQALTFVIQTAPRGGTLTDANGNPVTVGGTLPTPVVRYTPNAGFSGAESFTFLVKDNGGTDDTSTPATVTITVPAVTPPPPPPPTPPPGGVPDNATFINRVYQDVLGRAAEGPAVQAWAAQLTQGASRTQVLLAIQTSEEGRQRSVRELGQTLLGQPLDAGRQTAYAAVLNQGGTVEQIKADVLASPEYAQRKGSTNDTWLAAAYQDVFGRALDASGRATFTQALSAGVSKRQVADLLFGSEEYRRRFAEDCYRTYLQRPGEAAGLAFWIEQQRLGATNAQIITGFCTSSEYLSRQSAGRG